MKARTLLFTTALATVTALALPSAQSGAPAQATASGYLTPPKVIADIMDATPLPSVQLSRDRTMMLLSYRTAMPSIENRFSF